MSLALATANQLGAALRFAGGIGVNDGDVVIQTDDVSNYDTFVLMTTAGAAQVFVTIDGNNYATAPLNLTDMGALTTDPVTLTAANRIYRFRGAFSKIRVAQSGATAVANAALLCSRSQK